jgi:hypothetical protein
MSDMTLRNNKTIKPSGSNKKVKPITAEKAASRVDAAIKIQAAKEAVGKQQEASDRAIAKSEAAVTKQIDQIGSLINVMTGSFNDKIDDLKTTVLERLDR